MAFDFTPSARRALGHAHAAASGPLHAWHVLVGLLAESESRAAAVLASCGVDLLLVVQQWPDAAGACNIEFGDIQLESTMPKLPAELANGLRKAHAQLDELPPATAISTEHLLLALVDSSCDVGIWLRAQNISADALIAEIYRFHGVESGPLDVDLDSDAETTSRDGSDMPVSIGASTIDEAAMLRILDSSANRAAEAIRVVEDYLRFALDDAHLSLLAKQIRHDLNTVLSSLPLSRRLAARDTLHDVGTEISTETEQQRAGLSEVVAANFSRLQQSLRSLEEFTKIEHADLSVALEQLRYRVYTLHRAAGITHQSNERLAAAQLYVLIDGRENEASFRTWAAELVEAGVDVLQLRDKTLPDRELLQRARVLRDLTRDSSTLLIVNDRPDLAALAQADGVHVGQEELSVREVRQIVGVDALVGVSTHTIEQARQAVLDGANYIGVGPIFPSKTKDFDQLAGLNFAREVAAEISLPAFAIGGIHDGNLQQLLDTGVKRCAISAAVAGPAEPTLAVEKLRKILCRR